MMRRLRRALRRLASFLGEDRGLSALLPLLLISFLIIPLFSARLARVLGAVAISVVFVSGAANISGSRLVRRSAEAVVGLALLLRWLETAYPQPIVTAASTAASLLFFSLLTGQILRRVFRQGPVTTHRVQGAVAAYILFGICWALLYELIDLRLPAAFNVPAAAAAGTSHASNLVYFSFVTLTTLGYGDITAVHPVARVFVILEALTGQLYPATLLARLVSLEVMYREKTSTGEPQTCSGLTNSTSTHLQSGPRAPESE